jgi:orotidine-5'-phosphate decarboxylase
MTRRQLIDHIKQKKSYLCVGLDTTPEKIPPHLATHPDAIFEFNKQIIDATLDLCVAFKINTAFYEAAGAAGWQALQQTVDYIPSTHLKIADAKRGDIGNTASQYAKAFFDVLNFDAITIAPYMGYDSIMPFLEYKNKWTIVLGLTSNKGSEDFQQERTGTGYLYETVIRKVSEWGSKDNLMFVAGATRAAVLLSIREIVPDNFLLVPGVGVQGGDLAEVSKYGLNADCGLLVNVSRAIIYAGNDENFASHARMKAHQYQTEMMTYL